MSTHGVFFMSLLIAEATIRAEAMNLVTIQPQISRRYTVVTTYLTPGISNKVSAILRWSSCMHKWWGNQQDCSFSKFKPLDTLSGGSKVHTLQKTGPSYAKQCTLGKLYLRSNLPRKRMRKTNCFGKTRIVLHVPSSSWAGKRDNNNNYYY